MIIIPDHKTWSHIISTFFFIVTGTVTVTYSGKGTVIITATVISTVLTY